MTNRTEATRIGKFFKDFFSTDTAEGAAEVAKATFELAETLDKDEIKKLAPLIKQGASLLDVLNSPLAELAESTLPFIKVATGLLKFYVKVTGKEPTLAQQIALISQAAYLESFKANFLGLPKAQEWLEKIGKKPASRLVRQQIQQLDELELDHREARRTLLYFHDSKLATHFNLVLAVRMQDLGATSERANHFAERVARDTNRYMDQALEEMGENARSLREWYRGKSREEFEKYLSIDSYLEEQIKPCPLEPVFNESFSFRDIYVPLKAQLLRKNGEPDTEHLPVDLEDWVKRSLDNPNQSDRVLFIQGGPGRGKSVFCRMFADWIRQHQRSHWIPILIRLRDIRSLEKDFEETLRKAVDRDFADDDPGWLTDRNIRYLFLLDGFDELLMEGRTSGGLEEFLKQVGRFQESCAHNSEKQHRVVITGRSLSLQNIARLMPSNLERVEILPLDDDLQAQWFIKWGKLIGATPTHLNEILHDPRLPERVRELTREPLLLYLMAAMHRDGQLRLKMFAGAEATKAKVLVYEQSIDWALTKQRPEWLNRELTELETDSLRRILTEAGLCVTQSGGECAAIAMIEERLKHNQGVKSLLEEARTRLQDNPLRNALAAFYLQPGGTNNGSVEFVHKSFGEFLFAERLKEAIEDWSKPGDKRRGEFYVADKDLHWEIYDLLGYGGLTPEIVEYLMGLLDRDQEVDWIRLFKRLEDFYTRWCEGEFIDADPPTLPQQKMLRIRDLLAISGIPLGQRQVDVYAGLNVMILLLELHRYARTRDKLKDAIVFKPCCKDHPERKKNPHLMQSIGYSHSISDTVFTDIVGSFLNNVILDNADLIGAYLSGANLIKAHLTSADLSRANLIDTQLTSANLHNSHLTGADLSGANLSDANLTGVNLRGTNLSRANLTGTDLTGTDLTGAYFGNADLNNASLNEAHLSGANLRCANLSNADLRGAYLNGANCHKANFDNIHWSASTNWKGVRGLETAINVPEELKRQLGLIKRD